MKVRFACLVLVLTAGAGQCFGQAANKSTSQALPSVVASLTLTNVRRNILERAIFTPTSSGLFQITIYGTTTVKSPTLGCWIVNFFWTDETGSHLVPMSNRFNRGDTESCNPSGIESDQTLPVYDIEVVRAVGGTPISFDVFNTLNTMGSEYELFITIEQLQ
jgi:hypothetical protein